jgi:hypothetical protein
MIAGRLAAVQRLRPSGSAKRSPDRDRSRGRDTAALSPGRSPAWTSSPRASGSKSSGSTAIGTRRACRRLNLLIDLKDDLGLTYVFISHDLNVVRFISDRAIVMYLGEVVESGPVEALWEDARHPYTRAAGRHAVARSGQTHQGSADRGRSAQSDQSAVGLPLPHALRVRGKRVQRKKPGAVRDRQ